MRIRGGSGLGDALYVRPIAEYFVRNGKEVTVCSNYKDVFRGSGADVQPFSRDRIDVLAHYVQGKQNPNTTQWQDICINSGVDVPLQFKWNIRNPDLVDKMRRKASGRPIVIVHAGRAPMARTDGFGKELLPDRLAFQAALSAIDDCFFVMVGNGERLYSLSVDVDLNGSTTVSDILDIASICDGFLAQCSFVVPLAECFDKPLLAIWAASGLLSGNQYVSSITPSKILSKKTSIFAMDDWQEEEIMEAVRAFRQF